MAVEYNQLLQCKDFKEVFRHTDGQSATYTATKVKVTVTSFWYTPPCSNAYTNQISCRLSF